MFGGFFGGYMFNIFGHMLSPMYMFLCLVILTVAISAFFRILKVNYFLVKGFGWAFVIMLGFWLYSFIVNWVFPLAGAFIIIYFFGKWLVSKNKEDIKRGEEPPEA